MSAQLRDAIAVLRALRMAPLTVTEIAESTGVHWRKVYRLLEQLRELGAPIHTTGSQPTNYAMTAQALKQWLG